MFSILPFLNNCYKKLLTHRYGLSLCIYLGAAAISGIVCVFFMHAFDFVYTYRLNNVRVGYWCWLTTPLLFLAAVELIRLAAPCADGAGIPQTIFAAQHLSESNFKSLSPLISFRTMTIKIAALLIGVWGGASTGREGPSVHITACLFFGITWALHRILKLPFSMRSAIVGGAAAGLAAAFNTPLAGVTFAVEELSSDYFSSIKDMVLMAIIVAGIAAKTLTGEYTYFGHLNTSASISIIAIFSVGLASGLAGTLFSTLLIKGKQALSILSGWQRYISIFILALAVLFIAMVSGLKGIMGPGNLIAQNYLQGDTSTPPFFFAITKAAATLFTYWSGIAGGIFAPSLAMGSAVGAWTATLQHAPVAACAALGMAAFLSGAIQAPITSFVIIYEMTGHPQLLLPIMLASLIGYMVAKACKTQHLYQALSKSYNHLLSSSPG
ncbi:MAG TPA: chloride channel protein [Candidatus Omnitrophota bacterium]|nr:chloride channel protein [Candidatus Omnitrophota bacterium]